MLAVATAPFEVDAAVHGVRLERPGWADSVEKLSGMTAF